MKTLLAVFAFINLIWFHTCNSQKIAPGVPPQTYQQHQDYQQQQFQQQQYQQQPQYHHQQQQQQQQQYQHVPIQKVPVQQQQVPMQQIPVQTNTHHGHHGVPQSGQLLNTANIAQEKEHIAEHLEVPIDTSKMSEQELQFHYFKMHDADNNNKLDGCELIKSLIHWHEQGSKGGQNHVEEKIFKDEELVTLIDPILNMDDGNRDGFIDYPEFVRAQQKAAASASPKH